MEARLLKYDDNSTQDEQEWVLHGDPRSLSVCDKFVAGKRNLYQLRLISGYPTFQTPNPRRNRFQVYVLEQDIVHSQCLYSRMNGY